MKIRKPGTFTKGNQVAVGHKGGTGRPPDWLKNKCQELVEAKKIVEFITDVASGEYTEFLVSPTGQKLEMKASAKVDERLKAASMLLDRAFGRPEQAIKPVDDQGNYAPFHVYIPAQITGQEGTSK